MEKNLFNKNLDEYLSALKNAFTAENKNEIFRLAKEIQNIWSKGKKVFICGNGGSAANAIHMANDFLYGIGIDNKKKVAGLKVEALPSNTAVLTCLANDVGYEHIFSEQINVKGNEGDLLIVLSGSGNSQNVINAIEEAHKLKINTFSVVAFDGGKCKQISKNVIYFNVQNMRIAEDIQMIICNIIVEWINEIEFDTK